MLEAMNSVINWAFFRYALGFSHMITLHNCHTIIRSVLTKKIKAEGEQRSIINKSSQAIIISTEEAKQVMEDLGMSVCLEGCKEKWLAEAHVLLEEKEASMEELEETFIVFDENRDGFIITEELRVVLQRLRLDDGEDYETMIGAYDDDGDGRISFEEFKKLLDCTV